MWIPFDEEGVDEEPDWARLFFRPDGADTSEEAARRMLKKLPEQRIRAWTRWNRMVRMGKWLPTRNEFKFKFLPTLALDGVIGYCGRVTGSCGRRLCDFVQNPKKPKPPVICLLRPTGGRHEISQLLTYTEWGLEVLSEPALMAPHWGTPIGPVREKKPRKKKNQQNGDSPPEVEIEWED